MGTTSMPRASAAESKKGESPKAPDTPLAPRELYDPEWAKLSGIKEKYAVYWVGMRMFNERAGIPHPPFGSTTVGGVTFPSWSTPWDESMPSPDGDLRGGRHRFPGAIVRITESDMKALTDGLNRTAVRWREREGTHAHGQKIILTRTEHVKEMIEVYGLDRKERRAAFQKARMVFLQDGDEPLSKYIYCVKVTEPGVDEGSNWRPSGGIPESVFDLGLEAP